MVQFAIDLGSDIIYIRETPKQNALLEYGMLVSMLLPHVANLIRFTIKIHDHQIEFDKYWSNEFKSHSFLYEHVSAA